MSYVSEQLSPGEQLVYQGKVHWFVFVYPVILFLIAMMFSASPGLEVFYCFSAGAVFLLIRAVALRHSTEVAVTSKRVIAKYGLIQRHAVEMQHKQIESVSVFQGYIGRIFNFGNLYINGAGSRAPICCIAAPLEFRRQVMESIDRQQQAGAGAFIQNAANIPSMQELIDMKAKGHISEDEFVQFKKKILSQ